MWFPNLGIITGFKKIQSKIFNEKFHIETNIVALVVAQNCMALDLQRNFKAVYMIE